MKSRRIIPIVLIVVLLTPLQPNLHGGKYPRKDMSLWQLHKYKYTTLLQREPLSWCPYKWYWIDATLGDWLSRKQFEDRTVLEIW